MMSELSELHLPKEPEREKDYIAFKVIYASSSGGPKDAETVTKYLQQGQGWVSKRQCTYPQELILQFKQKANIVKMQISSHEIFIPQKIDFYIGSALPGEIPRPESVQETKFENLGFVEFTEKFWHRDDKRETKTIFVDAIGHFLQLKISANYSNSRNMHNQEKGTGVNQIATKPEWPRLMEQSSSASAHSKRDSAKSSTAGVLLQPVTRATGSERSKSWNKFRVDPLSEIRSLQTVLMEKRDGALKRDKAVEAKLCTAAIERLTKAENEIKYYYSLQNIAMKKGKSYLEVEKHKSDAESVRDTVVKAILLDLLLTPKEVDKLQYSNRPPVEYEEDLNDSTDLHSTCTCDSLS